MLKQICYTQAGKDAGKLSAARKQVDKDHKEACNAISAIVQELKEGDAVENVGSIICVVKMSSFF